MKLLDYAYIPIIALINLVIVYFWYVKVRKQSLQKKSDWTLLFVASFLTTWGMDYLHHLIVTTKVVDALQISLGVWLLFTAPAAFKYYRLKSMRLRDFWYDCAGDLISYFFIGLAIYVCT